MSPARATAVNEAGWHVAGAAAGCGVLSAKVMSPLGMIPQDDTAESVNPQGERGCDQLRTQDEQGRRMSRED